MEESFDTVPEDDLFQEDDSGQHGLPKTPVVVKNVVRTDEMPCHIGGMGRKLLVTGGLPELIVPFDPRRKRIIVWVFTFGVGGEVCVMANNQAEVLGYNGALLWPGGAGVLRYEFECTDELWARGADLTESSGSFTAIGPSTDDMILSFVTEQWSH